MHQDRRRTWARAVLLLVAIAALLVIVAPAALAQAQPTNPGQTQTTQPADPNQGRCDSIPNPVARNVCRAGTAPGQAVTSAVTGAAQNVVETAGDSAGDRLAGVGPGQADVAGHRVGDGVAALLGGVGRLVLGHGGRGGQHQQNGDGGENQDRAGQGAPTVLVHR